MSSYLATAVDATLARMAALQEAETQLERRRRAIRAMHYDEGMPKAEVARVLYNELRDQGLTTDKLKDAGVSLHSIMKVLSTQSEPESGPIVVA